MIILEYLMVRVKQKKNRFLIYFLCYNKISIGVKYGEKLQSNYIM